MRRGSGSLDSRLPSTFRSPNSLIKARACLASSSHTILCGCVCVTTLSTLLSNTACPSSLNSKPTNCFNVPSRRNRHRGTKLDNPSGTRLQHCSAFGTESQTTRPCNFSATCDRLRRRLAPRNWVRLSRPIPVPLLVLPMTQNFSTTS